MADIFAPAEALPLPLTVEEITPTWLTAALRPLRPGISVSRAEAVDINRGTSTKIRIRLECTGPGSKDMPPTLMIKGGFEEHSSEAVFQQMHSREARFYADIKPSVPIPSPICYFAGSDPASYQSIVIMEDLRRAGVDICDPFRPHGFEQVARRLSVMAAYHAATWNSPEFETGGRWSDIQSNFDSPADAYIQRTLEPEWWKKCMAAPRGAAISVQFHDREWMEHALKTSGQIQKLQPRCLIHGDTHIGNLYFYENGSPGFMDAQIMRAAWHHEVSYHIVSALDLADRPRWEGPLLQHYLDALAAHGIAAPDYEEAWINYRRSTVWGLFMFLCNSVRFQTEPTNTAFAARFAAAGIDHGVKQLYS